MTDFDTQSDRALLRENLTDEEWARLKAAEPGGGGGPNSKYFTTAKKDFALFGENLFGEAITQDTSGALRERFDFPPFSVLNAREGQWQERKRAWLSLGIKSEVGRGENLLKMSDTLLEPDPEKRAAMQAARGDARTFGSGGPGDLAAGFKARAINDHEGQARVLGNVQAPTEGSGTSIFDPVLTELSYRWFCPPGGQIVDPFAGGSVRGLVAGLLGFRYYGIDLRAEQIAANEAQRAQIAPDTAIEWACGDSNVLLKTAPEADLIFSCPPYGDLEQYSDDPKDLSAMSWNDFVGFYRAIIRKCVERLKDDRFAIFVVGEYRDKQTGLYRGFVPLTCASFMAAGAALYNEAILVTAVGSLPIRATKQFETSRKLGKTHQNILIFCKGDPKKAAEAIRQMAPERPASAPRPPAQTRPERPPVADSGPPPAPSGPSTMAQFLGTTAARAEPSWRPEEPPDLSQVSDIILNFATTGLEWARGDRPVGLTVSTLDGQLTRFLPFAFNGGGNLDEATVKRWAQEQLKGKKIHNANTRFDCHMSREWGVDLEAQGCTFTDIQHTAALLDDHRKKFALDVLATDYLPGNQEVLRVDERRHHEYHAGEVAERERYTAQLVGRLHAVMSPMIDAQELRQVQDLEDAVIPVTVEMEKNGARIDMELLERYSQECTREHQRLMGEVSEEAGFAFEHTAAGWQRLFERYGLPPSGSYAEDVIEAIELPIFQKAHKAGQIASLNSKTFAAYKKQIGADGILRYDINQLRGDEGGTVSGRFSIGYVHQVPNHDNHVEVFDEKWFPRDLYIPAEGLYLAADAAQIEYRVFSHFGNNPKVIEAYAQDPKMSFHKFIWELMKVHKPDMKYTWQKSLNFMKMYGGGLAKLALMMGFINKQQFAEIQEDPDNSRKWNDPLLKPAVEIQQIYERLMPEVAPLQARASHLAKSKCDKDCQKAGKHAAFLQSLHANYEHRGYVKTLTGRRSRFPNNWKTYRALNRVIQGSAADIMKQKLVELHQTRKETGFLLRMTVHDEVCGDVPDVEAGRKVDELLNRQSFPQLKVPILWAAKTGRSWAECK